MERDDEQVLILTTCPQVSAMPCSGSSMLALTRSRAAGFDRVSASQLLRPSWRPLSFFAFFANPSRSALQRAPCSESRRGLLSPCILFWPAWAP